MTADEVSNGLEALGGLVRAGGSAAALALWMSASVSGEAARHAGHASMQAQADVLQLRAAELAVADAEAFEQALAVLDDRRVSADSGDGALEQALARGVDALLAIAALADDAAELGGAVADAAEGDRRADAVAGAMLAAAAAEIVTHLVGENLLVGEEDARLAHARHCAAVAADVPRRLVRRRG